MTKKLLLAVALALSLNVLATAYGAAAVRQEARATCAHDHGAVRNGECLRDGRTLLRVPL